MTEIIPTTKATLATGAGDLARNPAAVYLAGLARSAGQADRLKAVLGSWDRSG